MNITDLLERIRNEYPQIRPFEEEDDIEWWNEGLDLIRDDKLDEAEAVFKKLALAQPNHPDGVHGLAMVYAAKQDRTTAETCFAEAARRAEQMIKDGDMDAEILAMIRADRDRLLQQ